MTQNKKGPNLINVGTPENPVLVPIDVAEDKNSVISTSWWNGIASGSIVVASEILDKLLGKKNDK